MTDNIKVAIGKNDAGEHEALLERIQCHLALGQFLNGAPEIVEVAGKRIHAVHDNRVAVAHKGAKLLQGRSLHILAGCLVGKRPVHGNIVELPFGILIEAAEPNVADAITHK